ncbi:LacI family DNA-binding transcriptional regulator [Actinophytocola oryzae]|uniref:LacI family DNA-binding transcriptional regulator n=1 Tax=Actinophytocola oryzae TaxID=502181 RepID=UPI001AAF1F0E|nr:LacI family DNA-binding transcriptional regulator [Actinophytocola oryzae]
MAARAGVSIATVSRALRDSELVAAPTRRRVRKVAEELRFRPSRAGRALAEGTHAANGIVFPDLSGPYYAEVVLGYEEVVAELGRSVLILATNGRANAEEAVLELAGRVDGMVIMGRTVPDRVVARIADTGLPLVLLARTPVGLVDTVTADNERSARELTAHLLGHGHRTFAFLGDPGESPDVAGRYAGFRAALADGGLGVPEPTPCVFDVGAGYVAARTLLSGDRPDALVCANDEVALGALRAAEDLGLSVPGDLALTGWDDIMAAHYARLTTVDQSMRVLGATAARWLDERIQGAPTQARRSVLPTRLVVRTSCGVHESGGTT